MREKGERRGGEGRRTSSTGRAAGTRRGGDDREVGAGMAGEGGMLGVGQWGMPLHTMSHAPPHTHTQLQQQQANLLSSSASLC